MNRNYEKFFESLKELSSFKESVPFREIVKNATGYEIRPFNIERNTSLFSCLYNVMDTVVGNIKINPINEKRPNEAGTEVERRVKEELADRRLIVETSKTGYPDMTIDFNGKRIYLECKTYSLKTRNSRLRTFYFTFSRNSKITCNAHHLMVSFEMIEPQKDLYTANCWSLYSLDTLNVKLKLEINTDNVEMYESATLLAE